MKPYISFGVFVTVLTGCSGLQGPIPADRNAIKQTWTYDCCNPSLSEGTKDMCKMAATARNHTLIDNYGNRYKFIWSDCEPGKEKWREYE